MATLISIATGNFTTAATWGVCDSTAALDSEAGNTVLTTSYVASSAFTPGAITIDAIAVKVALRVGTTGTMSVELYNSTGAASVVGTEVTINTIDIDAGDTAANGGCGWYVFAFAAPVLLLAATNYTVRAKTSTATMINLFRDGTAGNWSRQLRTTTTQAPIAADILIVAGDWTAATTSSSYVVTMNETATTDYGVITVNNKATLTYGVAASTNYYLKTSGVMFVYGGAIFQIGTSGSPMPSTSTAVLEFDSVATAGFGLQVPSGGTFTVYGNALTYAYTTLDADAIATATSLTTAVSTGWKNGDVLAIATTTRTRTECETKALTADAITTALTIAALTNAHGGNAATGVRAHIANLTRNVKMRGVNTTTGTGYCLFRAGATIDMNWVEVYNWGSTAGTANRTGINVQTTTASYFRGISSYNCYICLHLAGTSQANIVVEDFVGYNSTATGFYTVATSGSGNSLTRVLLMRLGGYGFQFFDTNFNLSNCIAVGAVNSGIYFDTIPSGSVLGTVDSLECYGHTQSGILLDNTIPSGIITNVKVWRLGSTGIQTIAQNATPSAIASNLLIDGITAFGNSSAGVYLTGDAFSSIRFNNYTSNGGVTLVQNAAVDLNASYIVGKYMFTNCDFGSTQAHLTADLLADSYAANVVFNNCKFGSTTEISAQSSLPYYEGFKGVSSINHDQTTGNHKRWMRYGTATTDTVIFNTASPSERLTPTSATYKIESASKFVAIASGAACTVSAYSRKSVVGDGTAYNGNQPRLMVRANASAGITADTVIDTHSAAAGTWEQLTGATAAVSSDCVLEFYLDCDGTTGWCNFDDWATTTANDPRGVKYWGEQGAYIGGEYAAGGAAGGSYVFG